MKPRSWSGVASSGTTIGPPRPAPPRPSPKPAPRGPPRPATAPKAPCAAKGSWRGSRSQFLKLLLKLLNLLLELFRRDIGGIPGPQALLKRLNRLLELLPLGRGRRLLLGRGHRRLTGRWGACLGGCGRSLLRRAGLGKSGDGRVKRDSQGNEYGFTHGFTSEGKRYHKCSSTRQLLSALPAHNASPNAGRRHDSGRRMTNRGGLRGRTVQEPDRLPGADLCRVLLRIVRIVEHGSDRFGLVRSRCQEHGISRAFQYAWQQRHAPLIELRRENRGGNAGMVLDKRRAWEEAGRVRVRAHASMYHVEAREFGAVQFEKAADVCGVARGGFRRVQLAVYAMDVRIRNMRRLDQVHVSQLIVARVIGGRHATLVHPEQVHAIQRKAEA